MARDGRRIAARLFLLRRLFFVGAAEF